MTKNVPGYEDYSVTSKGIIIAKSGKRLKPYVDKFGYSYVQLYGPYKRFSVHQLVAMAFLGHKPNGRSLHVNHINFDKLDNRLENLKVVSARENLNKKHLDSTSNYTGVCWKKENKKWQAKIVIKNNHFYLGIFESEMRAKIAYDLALFQENKIKQLLNI